MAWSKPYTVNEGAGGDSVHNGFVKTGDNIDDLYTDANLLKTTFTGTTAPASPDTGQVWSDTNYTPALFKFYNGSIWVPIVRKQGRGALTNGYISVTDAAGLTVAIKNNLGTDPTTTNPVVVNIGGTERIISAALSVAKADGTNWGNAGGAEQAAQELDWFVYLGYNATDGVVIGFSRYPGSCQYSDFSATSTNEKYCAISTITNAAAGDDYELIGRFAATLSAGAGYTWTVPTYTTINLIQRPIYETRSLTALPVEVGYSGTPTIACYYYLIGKQAKVILYASGTSDGDTFTLTLPFLAKYSSFFMARIADNTSTIAVGMIALTSGSNVATIYSGPNSAAWTAANTKIVYTTEFIYEIA